MSDLKVKLKIKKFTSFIAITITYILLVIRGIVLHYGFVK